MGIDAAGRRRAVQRWQAIVAASLLAGGCSVGPVYRTPDVETPAGWSLSAASAAAQDVASRATTAPFDGRRWWRVFADPLLDRLIDEAAAQNLDLQTAALRIASARAQRNAQAGAAYPQVAGTGVAGRSRMSENGIAGVLGGGSSSSGGGSSGGGGGAAESPSLASNLFQAGFDATWELDLWGKVRRNVEAADADLAAAVAGRDDALASLGAEIARSYFGLRGAERQLAIVHADVATRQRLAELAASRSRAGFTARADVVAQTAEVQAALAQLPGLEQDAAQARNRLALLLALAPGALDARLAPPPGSGGCTVSGTGTGTGSGSSSSSSSSGAGPGGSSGGGSFRRGSSADRGLGTCDTAAPITLPPEVPIGLPGDLLRRRPDVRRSEAELRAATARVGAARARLFPSITLGLAAGLQSTLAGDLTDWGSRFALGGASVTVPIFQGGQLRAQVELAGVEAQRRALAYRQAVLAAVHDADNALVAYDQEQRRAAALERQLAEARRSRELAAARWQQGLAAFIDVLDAERNAHQAERALAESTTAASTHLVALFKALGGGWES